MATKSAVYGATSQQINSGLADGVAICGEYTVNGATSQRIWRVSEVVICAIYEVYGATSQQIDSRFASEVAICTIYEVYGAPLQTRQVFAMILLRIVYGQT